MTRGAACRVPHERPLHGFCDGRRVVVRRRRLPPPFFDVPRTTMSRCANKLIIEHEIYTMCVLFID
jgi:hypothetical protein